MFPRMLIICSVLKMTFSHSIPHDHWEENRYEAYYGPSFGSETYSFGSQSILQRRHLQDSSYVNLHTAAHHHGVYSHFSSGESRVNDFYNYKKDVPVTVYRSNGFRNNNNVNNVFNLFVPQTTTNYPKTNEILRSRELDQNFEQEKVIKVTEDPLNNVGVLSHQSDKKFNDQDLFETAKQRKLQSNQNVNPKSVQENTQQKKLRPLPYTTPKASRVNDVSHDSWIWPDSFDEVKKTSLSTSTTTAVPELDNRGAFDVPCAPGQVRVLEKCVDEDK